MVFSAQIMGMVSCVPVMEICVFTGDVAIASRFSPTVSCHHGK